MRKRTSICCCNVCRCSTTSNRSASRSLSCASKLLTERSSDKTRIPVTAVTIPMIAVTTGTAMSLMNSLGFIIVLRAIVQANDQIVQKLLQLRNVFLGAQGFQRLNGRDAHEGSL